MGVKRELKAKVRLVDLDIDPAIVRSQIKKIGKYVGKEVIVDYFFTAENMDEKFEFRLRRFGDKKRVTFKISLSQDLVQKNEEYDFGVDDWDDFVKFIEILGFKPLSALRKVCKVYNARDIDIRLSEVDEVGEFVEVTLDCKDAFSLEKEEKILSVLRKIGVPEEKLDNRYYGVIKAEADGS